MLLEITKSLLGKNDKGNASRKEFQAIGLNEAVQLELLYITDRSKLREYIFRELRTARRVENHGTPHREEKVAHAQWRGARAIFFPEDCDTESEHNYVTDTMLFLLSAMQDYTNTGYSLSPRFNTVTAVKTTQTGINPITAQNDVAIDFDSRSDLRLHAKIKQNQSTKIKSQNGVVRSLNAAEKIPIIVNRTLNALDKLAEEDPNLLVKSLEEVIHLQGARLPEHTEKSGDAAAPAIALMEMARVIGWDNNNTGSSLFKALQWYVKGYRKVRNTDIEKFNYTVNQKESGLLFAELPPDEQTRTVPPNLTPQRLLMEKILIKERELREQWSGKNIALVHTNAAHLKITSLKEDIRMMKKRLAYEERKYKEGWSAHVNELARVAKVPVERTQSAPTPERLRQTSLQLMKLFEHAPGLPQKVDSTNTTYFEVFTQSSLLGNHPLTDFIRFAVEPTFNDRFLKELIYYPEAYHDLLRHTFSELVSRTFRISKEKTGQFLRISESKSTIEDHIRGFYFSLHDPASMYWSQFVEKRVIGHETRQARYLSYFMVDTENRMGQSFSEIEKRNAQKRLAKTEWRKMKEKKALNWYLLLIALTLGIKGLGHWIRSEGVTAPPKEGNTTAYEPSIPIPDSIRRPRTVEFAEIIQQTQNPINALFIPQPELRTGIGFPTVTKVQTVKHFGDLVYPKNTLVLSIKNESMLFAPPGWEILSVYTKKNVESQTLSDGMIVFSKNPGEIVMVLKQRDSIPPLIQSEKGVEYNPILNSERIQKQRVLLAQSPELQNFYVRFSTALQSTRDKNEQSEIILRFLEEYRNYINQYRYYSFSTPGMNDSVDGLNWIAQHPDAGFECEVADRATREMLESLGIITYANVGMPTRELDGKLWGDWGHVNSMVFLPNGMIAVVDNTPPISNKTPESDIKALEEREPGFIAKNAEDIKTVAQVLGGISIVFAGMYLYMNRESALIHREEERTAKKSKRKQKDTSNDTELPWRDASEMELIIACQFSLKQLKDEEEFRVESTKVIQALSRYTPQLQKTGNRAGYIQRVAESDDLAPYFAHSDPQQTLKALRVDFDSQIIHSELPESIATFIRLGSENTEDYEQFVAFHTLVRKVWEAHSGFAKLAARVKKNLHATSGKPNIRQLEINSQVMLRQLTTDIPKNKYAIRVLDDFIKRYRDS